MSTPTAREIVRAIRAHERLLDAMESITEDDSLAFLLTSRVEAVLALHHQAPPPIPRCDHCWGEWPCQTVRLLNGEKP